MKALKVSKLFPKLLLGLVAGALLIGSLVNGGERSVAAKFALQELARDGEIPAQALRQRQMKEPVWKRDLSFAGVNGNIFYYLITLRLSERGEVFVLDWGAHSVRKFSPFGQELKRYGEGQGSGPGELLGPMDFALDSTDGVWVPDEVNGAVIAFAKDGTYKTTIRNAKPPRRIVFGSGDRLITTSPGQELFQKLAVGGGSAEAFGRLVDQRPEASMVMDGWMAAIGSDKFVYAPLYAGLLIGFDFDGQPRFVVKTIEPAEPPKVEVDAKGTMRLDPEAKPVTYNVNVDGDRIFVLARPTEGRWRNERVIDVYRSSDGVYLYSLPAPEKCKAIAVRGREVYTLTATNVTRWRLEG